MVPVAYLVHRCTRSSLFGHLLQHAIVLMVSVGRPEFLHGCCRKSGRKFTESPSGRRCDAPFLRNRSTSSVSDDNVFVGDLTDLLFQSVEKLRKRSLVVSSGVQIHRRLAKTCLCLNLDTSNPLFDD